MTAVTVTLWAQAEGPYEIRVDILTPGAGRQGWIDPVADGAYSRPVRLSTGRDTTVRMSVHASRPGSGARCWIVGGTHTLSLSGESDGQYAECELTTRSVDIDTEGATHGR